jgi:hypothetical protein
MPNFRVSVKESLWLKNIEHSSRWVYIGLPDYLKKRTTQKAPLKKILQKVTENVGED